MSPTSEPVTDHDHADQEPSAPLIEIDSFLPLITKLSNHHVHPENIYHIVGVAPEKDILDLFALARKVGTVRLADNPADQTSTISSGSYIRLAQLQTPGTPFFPSLNRLRIDHAGGSLDELNLLVTNSLRVLEVVNIDDSQYPAFIVFLCSLTEECPRLRSITLSSRPIDWLEACLEFSHLRELKLDGILHELDLDMLVAIGKGFPELETFILNAEYDSCISTPQLKTDEACEVSGVPVPLGSQDEIQEPSASTTNVPPDTASPSDDRAPQDGAKSPPASPAKKTPEPTFRQLKKLHIVGCLQLIQDVLSLCSGLEDVSLTLVRLGESTDSEIARTEIFASIIERIFDWNKCLARMFIGQNWQIEVPELGPAILPSRAVQKLFLHSTLQHLEIANWALDAFATYLSCLAPRPPFHFNSMLTTLHLPVGSISPGISLSDLRHLAISCPHLSSLRSTILLDLNNLPVYKIGRAADVALHHKLETLSVGSANGPAWNWMQYCTAARHLFALFPAVKIQAQVHPGWNPVRWMTIRDTLRMYQTVCLDNKARRQPYGLDL